MLPRKILIDTYPIFKRLQEDVALSENLRLLPFWRLFFYRDSLVINDKFNAQLLVSLPLLLLILDHCRVVDPHRIYLGSDVFAALFEILVLVCLLV